MECHLHLYYDCYILMLFVNFMVIRAITAKLGNSITVLYYFVFYLTGDGSNN